MRSTLLVVLPALALLAGCPSEVKPPAPPPPAPEIISFTASANSVAKGDSVTLSWETKDATTLELRDSEKGLVSGVDASAASGQIEAFNINILQAKGSLFATRPTLNHYAAKREDLLSISADLFDKVGSGAVKIPVNQKYALKDARKAHEDLESRHTTGSSILIP